MKRELQRPTIKLSVVIVAPNFSSSLATYLDSIFANKNLKNVEVIVSGWGRDEIFSELAVKYPVVKFLKSTPKAGIQFLSAAGIKNSAGEIIALTDSSCCVAADWIASILKAHRGKEKVVGGAVDPSEEKMKHLDWAAYFCDYGQFASPLKRGAADALPGNNISFARSILEETWNSEKKEFWKTNWCREIQLKGIELIAEPSVTVYYTRKFQLSVLLARRFQHGRCFAGRRREKMRVVARLAYCAGSFVLPFVMLYRISFDVLGKKRFLKKFRLAFPYVVLAVFAWSVGETCGYLAGVGKSCHDIR